MAKLIKDVYDLVFFLGGKNIATKQPPERIDLAFYEIILSLFNEHYDHYVKNQKMSDFLLPYKRKAIITLSGGIATLPPDYNYARLITLTDNKTKVDLVEDKFWSARATSKVDPPSAARPIANIEDTGESVPTKVINVLPSTTENIVLRYFKVPDKPKYAYTVSGTRYVYDEANSVDVEFGAKLLPNLQLKLLNRLGFNLREQEMQAWATRMRQEENTK